MSEPARIVEVGEKQITDREATAECILTTTPEACAHLVAGTRKGKPIEAARIAGLMGVKRTPDLLPFCHPIAVTGAEVVLEPDERAGTIRVQVTVRAKDRTGRRDGGAHRRRRRRPQPVRHHEGVRPRGAHRRSAPPGEVRRQERRLPSGLSGPLGYDAGMLGTYNDWMLSLPAVLQVLVALATLTVIGLTPLLLWLGFAVVSTRDASRGDAGIPRSRRQRSEPDSASRQREVHVVLERVPVAAPSPPDPGERAHDHVVRVDHARQLL